MRFLDGLKSLVSDLVNQRQATATNTIVTTAISDTELRAIYKTGLGSKIVRIKNGYALKTPMLFDDALEKIRYEKHILKHVKKAGSFMVGFGRAIILINVPGADHSTPVTTPPKDFKLDIFSGDLVTPLDVTLDLNDERYYKPKFFAVRGKQFHHSRVVDFRYVEPPEHDLPTYRYGGISEFELVYNQLINDGVVERASSAIIDKNSTLFYKVKGFKEALRSRQEKDILDFYSTTEKARSIFGAGLVDADDDIVNIDQTLSNLDSVDQITLRRLAMVTGIPLAILVGEAVRGMNSTGETEKQLFNEMIETLQVDYYLDPINDLLTKIGMRAVEFSPVQNITPTEKVNYESTVIDNAKKLWEMGEDPQDYLITHDVITPDDFAGLFADEDA